MKELYLNDQLCDLNKSEPIQYNFQVNTIGDIESRQASFTNTISLPKTPRNIQIMKGLGLVGDTSRMPYQKIKADLFEFSVPIMTNGWAVISNTDSAYNLNIYTGIIDLFKAIENKTIGSDLDLSEVSHNKDLNTVGESVDNPLFKYIIADYNGKVHLKKDNITYINIDYLVPSISCQYLIDKIQETFGFEFEGNVFQSDEYLNWWMSYPKPAIEVVEEDEAIEVEEVANASIRSKYVSYSFSIFDIAFDEVNAFTGSWIDTKKYVIEKNGTYKLECNGYGMATYTYKDPIQFEPKRRNLLMYVNVYVNGQRTENEFVLNRELQSLNIQLRAGDVVELKYIKVISLTNGWKFDNFLMNDVTFEINQISSGFIQFGDALIEFDIKDFFKEFLWLFGLTPIPLKNNKVKFLTIQDIINSEVVDWSNKFNGRTNEQYIYGNYAQKNHFKHKYNVDNSNYNDGYIQVYNENLEDAKDVIQSKVYTIENYTGTIYVNADYKFNSNVYPIWSKDIDEDADGESVITYNQLSNRYYFIRSFVSTIPINLGSENLQVYGTYPSYNESSYFNLKYAEVVENVYYSLNALINNSRIHSIRLKNLSPVEVSNLRFDVLYYFEQEQQYYILNKLTYQADRTENVGEFIRIVREYGE